MVRATLVVQEGKLCPKFKCHEIFFQVLDACMSILR